MIMMMVEAMTMIKCSKLEKKERERQNGLNADVYLIGPFYFGD